MEASTILEVSCSDSPIRYGFFLTEKYVVAMAEKCIVHSLQCQQCQRDRGQVCHSHHAEIDTGRVWDADCHPASHLLLTATRKEPGEVGLWNLEDGTHIRDFLGHSTPPHKVIFLNSESRYASGSENGEILLWNREEEKPTHILRGHTSHITGLLTKDNSSSPGSSDNYLFSGSGDKTVRIWDTTSGACIRVLEGHADYVSVLAFTPDYSILRAGCGHNGETQLWDWREGKLVAKFQSEARTVILYSDVKAYLVTGGFDGLVRTWTQEGTLIKSFTAHEGPMRGLVNVGGFLATAGIKDAKVKVWDWESQRWLFDLQDPAGFIDALAGGYGKLAVASRVGGSHEFQRIQVWDVNRIEELATRHVTHGE